VLRAELRQGFELLPPVFGRFLDQFEEALPAGRLGVLALLVELDDLWWQV